MIAQKTQHTRKTDDGTCANSCADVVISFHCVLRLFAQSFPFEVIFTEWWNLATFTLKTETEWAKSAVASAFGSVLCNILVVPFPSQSDYKQASLSSGSFRKQSMWSGTATKQERSPLENNASFCLCNLRWVTMWHKPLRKAATTALFKGTLKSKISCVLLRYQHHHSYRKRMLSKQENA